MSETRDPAAAAGPAQPETHPAGTDLDPPDESPGRPPRSRHPRGPAPQGAAAEVVGAVREFVPLVVWRCSSRS